MTTHPFFGDVPEVALRPLYAAAKILIGHVAKVEPARATSSLEHLEALTPPEATAEAGMGADKLGDQLDNALKRLRGDLKKAPVAAMVAARLPPPGEAVTDERAESRRRRANWITGIALVALLERHRADPLENAIREGANEVRRLKRQDPDLLDRLAIEGADMEAVESILAGMLAAAEAQVSDIAAGVRGKEADAAEKAALGDARRIRNRLGPIEALLRACRERRPPIRRDFHCRRQAARAPMVFTRSSEAFDRVIDIFELEDEAENHALAPPPTVERADAPPERAYVARTPDAPAYDDLADDRRKTRMAARAEATRALALPADYDALTDHEARVFVEVSRAAPGDDALQFALAMLVFGRSDRRLARIPFAQESARGRKMEATEDEPVLAAWRMLHGRLNLEVRVALPTCKADAETLGHFTPVAGDDEALTLDAPSWLSDRALRSPPDAAALTAALGRLRDRVARPFSRGRLAAHRQLWLRRAGADSAMIGILCGLDPEQTAQMHYTVAASADLVDLHRRFLREALGVDLPPKKTTGCMGSRVRPDFDLLRAVAETLRDQLSAPLRPGARLDEIAAAHDAFACHTLLVLMLATGHRPVGAPFERLGDFDLVGGLVWISDKRTRKGRASRIALLPPAGLAQVHAWLRHLEALDRRLTPFRPDTVRERLRPALRFDDAEAPALFFFLDAVGGVVDVSVEAMGDRMEDILPVQLNWPRHVLRSRLASGGALAQAVDALLGHGSATEAPFGRHSALTIDDLRPLSDRAAALLADLGFAAVESPL